MVDAKQSSEEKYRKNNHAENTGFVSQEQYSKDPMVELQDRFSLLPALESSKTGEHIVDLHEGINVYIALSEFHTTWRYAETGRVLIIISYLFLSFTRRCRAHS